MIIDYSNLVQGTNRCSSKSSSARLYRVESWHLRCWSASFRWLGPPPSGGLVRLLPVATPLFPEAGPPPSGGDSALSGHLSNHIQRGVVASLQPVPRLCIGRQHSQALGLEDRSVARHSRGLSWQWPFYRTSSSSPLHRATTQSGSWPGSQRKQFRY